MNRFCFGAALSAVLALAVAPEASAQPVQKDGSVYYKHLCDAPRSWDEVRCEGLIVTDSHGVPLMSKAPPVSGLTPADLYSAYAVTPQGSPSTIIAIIDAGGYPTAETDMGAYRSEFKLPACTTANGCFKKLNTRGEEKNYAPPIGNWPVEQALDLDMASAMCPNCTIYLIEGKTPELKQLGAAEDTAANLGAHVISNSFCGNEAKKDTGIAHYYDHAGVAITASAGDGGYGMCAPANMPTVIAVGGTFLSTAQNKRGWNETVWNGTGSGCSTVFAKPTWQTDSGCAMRTNTDVAAVASPSSAVAFYYNGAWGTVGGTSVAAPLIGGLFGANGGTVNAASTIYSHTTDLFDVTQGSNGSCSPAYLCTGEVGYDGPTGNGTPNGLSAFGN